MVVPHDFCDAGGTDLLEITSGNISEFARVLQKLTLPSVLSSLTSIKSGAHYFLIFFNAFAGDYDPSSRVKVVGLTTDGSFSGTTVGRFQCLQKYFTLLQTYFTDGKGSNLHDGEPIFGIKRTQSRRLF